MEPSNASVVVEIDETGAGSAVVPYNVNTIEAVVSDCHGAVLGLVDLDGQSTLINVAQAWPMAGGTTNVSYYAAGAVQAPDPETEAEQAAAEQAAADAAAAAAAEEAEEEAEADESDGASGEPAATASSRRKS